MHPRGLGPDDIPDDLPIVVDPLVRSPAEGWGGLTLRAHSSTVLGEPVPPLLDHLVTAYTGPRTWLARRIEGSWTCASRGPGDVSLQTRGVESRWLWTGRLDVVNVYLSHAELVATGEEMFGRELDDIVLIDRLQAEDGELERVVAALRREATTGGGPGSRLLVGSLTSQLAVTLLRRHAHLRLPEQRGPGVLTPRQERLVRDYVAEHLDRTMTLDELAAVLLLSRFHFGRVFRRTTGLTPHEFVLRARIERACALLRGTAEPIGAVAARCGFADHSHLARVFRQRLGVTPSEYRDSTSS